FLGTRFASISNDLVHAAVALSQESFGSSTEYLGSRESEGFEACAPDGPDRISNAIELVRGWMIRGRSQGFEYRSRLPFVHRRSACADHQLLRHTLQRRLAQHRRHCQAAESYEVRVDDGLTAST